METKQSNKSTFSRNAFLNGDKSKNEVNMNNIRDFIKNLIKGKKYLLEGSFKDVKTLAYDLENLKLQNEEMEIMLKEILEEKNQLEDSTQMFKGLYDTFLKQYMDTKAMLLASREHNSQMSAILEKMRENEKCLITETKKLRKYGSTQNNNQQQDNTLIDTIGNLEKEVKFWQQEAEKLSGIIELNDRKIQLTSSKYSTPRKKSNKEIKRYDKIVKRSHSVETAQRKSKEVEFEKLKTEKLQLKNLLNDLERQVAEIQNNVLKISEERQKYKDLYYKVKTQCDHNENVNVNMERTICDLSNENAKISCQHNKLSKEIGRSLTENIQLKQTNENIIKEMDQLKINHEYEIKNLESKLQSFVKENHDIGVRSSNLKSSIVSLEEDFKIMEEDFQEKSLQIANLMTTNATLDADLNNVRCQLNEKSESFNNAKKKLSSLEEINSRLQHNEHIMSEKIEKQNKELNDFIKTNKEKDEIINNMKISFSANIVKLENHLQKAEQILTSKIKLITSLELKISNNDKELKLREEEILLLKKTLNSKEHDLEILNHKYAEISERKKYLEQHSENITLNLEGSNREIIVLNEVINEMKRTQEKTKNDIKTLKGDINCKQDQMVILESQIDRLEKDITLKVEEISKHKKIISQLNNEVEKKESHISSLLSLLEGKEEKILMIQSNHESQERKVKEYAEKLRNYDDSTIQFTARNNALEEEIEIINNNNIRLSRQKEQLSLMLSARNKTIGQLQAQLGDKNERQSIERIHGIKTLDKLCPESNNVRRSRSKDKSERSLNKDIKNNFQHQFIPIRVIESLSDNYDPKALRNRTISSFNG